MYQSTKKTWVIFMSFKNKLTPDKEKILASCYDTAQICLNGHVVNTKSVLSPENNRTYCDKCKSITITECKNCNRRILGAVLKIIKTEFCLNGHITNQTITECPRDKHGVFINPPYVRPSYCDRCGTPYPWTVNDLKAKTRRKSLKIVYTPK